MLVSWCLCLWMGPPLLLLLSLYLISFLLFSCLMPSSFTSTPLLFPQTGGPSKEAAVRWLVTSLLLNVEAEKDRPSQLLSSSSGFTENLSAGEYEHCLWLCHAAQCSAVQFNEPVSQIERGSLFADLSLNQSVSQSAAIFQSLIWICGRSAWNRTFTTFTVCVYLRPA